MPQSALTEYESSALIRENKTSYNRIRDALHKVRPEKYRGFGRPELTVLPPPGDENAGDLGPLMAKDTTNQIARRKLWDLMAYGSGQNSNEEWNFTDINGLRAVWSSLEDKEAWEIICLARTPDPLLGELLGFDLGWGTSAYSILCDAAIMPCWHPPTFDALDALSMQVARLNKHMLFDTVSDAENYLRWYRTQPWSEYFDEPDPQFLIFAVHSVEST